MNEVICHAVTVMRDSFGRSVETAIVVEHKEYMERVSTDVIEYLGMGYEKECFKLVKEWDERVNEHLK